MQFLQYQSLDSSQNEAKRLIDSDDLKLPSCIITEEQTAGRGQRGKSWASPRGAGLYATVVLLAQSSKLKAQSPDEITITVSKQLLKALNDWHPADYYIKPINDIYFDNCKLAGILVEIYKEHFLIGIGLNLRQMPRQIKEVSIETPKAPPISLEEITDIENFNPELFLENFFTDLTKA